MKLFGIIGLTVLFLIISINLFVMLVMYIAEDIHVPDHVKIYELFEAERYQNIKNQLIKHNYTILIGDDESGVKNFIEHQANIRAAEGRPVVVKRYQTSNQEKLKLFQKIKETKFYMELALGLGRKERTQIFFIKTAREIPLEEIKFIREKYPNDNIIVISQNNIDRIEGFKKVEFPSVSMKEMKKMMQLYYHLGTKQIQKIISNNYNSIERIFDYFKNKSKFEGELEDQIVDVKDIEDLNEISHERAEKQKRKIADKAKEKRKQNKKIKK